MSRNWDRNENRKEKTNKTIINNMGGKFIPAAPAAAGIPQAIINKLQGKFRLVDRLKREDHIRFIVQTQDGPMWFDTTTSEKTVILSGPVEK